MTTPRVTVVIPTHNRRDLLTATLRGIFVQTIRDIEVIVVDDGSTDGTEAMLSEIEDDRVRLIRHSAPRGVASARNAGIAQASSDWIAFTDTSLIGRYTAQTPANMRVRTTFMP